MKKYLVAALMPPIGACRYGCGTNCAPPISVFWLFGVISVIYGLLGGPTEGTAVNWPTVGLGVAMWAIAAVWTLLTLQGIDQDRCHGVWSPRDHQVPPRLDESDPMDEVHKAH
jgi:hypothetical protein